ncbi:MAG: hypothetical protein QOF57_1231 [Frankiaceae bacterium]|jgi:hypothetical protein|nr:hypothetical protein [Frankiaceae bacterium]MDQ1726086.1 hypothetical protein [Frankiaceae bacterium]
MGMTRWRERVAVAHWALRTTRYVHRQLPAGPLERLTVPPAPRTSGVGGRIVRLVLWGMRATCLEESLVLQRWFADNGTLYDIVIGVKSPREAFAAHAWLERPGALTQTQFREMTRVPAAAADGGGR